MAKITRQLAIQIACHLETGDFGENGNLEKQVMLYFELGCHKFYYLKLCPFQKFL